MAKKEVNKNPTIRFIKLATYKGYTIVVQQIISVNIFQCIVFKDGYCYQAHEIISPPVGNKEHTQEEVIKCGILMLDTAFQIVDELEKRKSEEKTLTKGKRVD